MRPSVVRLIAGKETRDLLRDRRTVLIIFVLPLVLYPLFGLLAFLFLSDTRDKPPVIGVVGLTELTAGESAVPRLVADGRFPAEYQKDKADQVPVLRAVEGTPEEVLRDKGVDAVVVVPPGFMANLEAGRKPPLEVRSRDGDLKSKIAKARLREMVAAWEKAVRRARYAKAGLPPDFDDQITLVDPQADRPPDEKAATELRDQFARMFPLLLVMWVVAGAIQPAVDLTAGERERGTLETLLISPAERTEIVAGKFLAVTAFALASVLWNVLCLTAGAVLLQFQLGHPVVNLAGTAGCLAVGVLPAMLFAALGVALGVFARSTKEGQYYLMPLMLVVMPLAFWTVSPTTTLTPVTAVVPVTGPMLLQQRLLAVGGDPPPWWAWAEVLAAHAAYIGAALALAVRQFRSEAVLFREAGPTKAKGLFAGLLRKA